MRYPPHDHPHTHSDPLLYGVVIGLVTTDVLLLIVTVGLIVGWL